MMENVGRAGGGRAACHQARVNRLYVAGFSNFEHGAENNFYGMEAFGAGQPDEKLIIHHTLAQHVDRVGLP
jgi:hypothetical protein